MIKLGIDEDKIAVCGTTLRPLEPIAKQVVKQNIGIQSSGDNNEKIVIFGSGSLGIGFDVELLKSYLKKLVTTDPNINVLVLCGKNESLKHELIKLNLPNVFPLGFYKNPIELYQIGDVLLTKPGGLTIAEALQAGIKIQITHTLPGQEEPNYDYLLEHHLVYPVPQPLTADNLILVTTKLFNTDDNSSETLFAQRITNAGQEGQILKQSVNKVFHDV
jgi:UDP-N-acetylglucosamine:LPS N-acetylglucosamine transferase